MIEVKSVPRPKLGSCIVFKGKKYSVPKLQNQTGPMLELTAGQLHAESNSLVEGTHEVLHGDYSLPLVNKFEGFYVVLIGRKAFEEAAVNKQPVKCRLISNPTLKNTITL